MSAIVISSAAVAISAANTAQIAQQHREQCQLVVNTFDSKSATVAQSQTYAECVQLIYPKHVAPTGWDLIATKAAIILALVLMVVGARIGWVKGRDDIDAPYMGAALFALAVPLGTACAMLVLTLIAGAIYWVCTA